VAEICVEGPLSALPTSRDPLSCAVYGAVYDRTF